MAPDSTLSPALVTGAGRGLGAEIARHLARHGAEVVLVARTAAEVEAVARGIGEDRALAIVADVSVPAQVDAAVATAVKRFGPPRLLVNNAAILGPVAPIWKSDPEEWWRVQRVNVFGAYLCLRA